jgi:D-alanyl-lipoteichoic acid acyltransferase DltB (MBOAT superfamily)
MIFHSLDFLLFFGVVLAVYWSLSLRAQNCFLLVASYFFYGYVHPWFLTLLAASTIVDYTLARAIASYPAHRRRLVIASLVFNLSLLGFFKYFGFFVENVWLLLERLGFHVHKPVLAIVLPVGISFYTFQTLSYTIDVYRGRLEARRDFIDFAAFLALFPQLVAGPIERATHLLPQVESPRRFDPERAREGLLLMCWGFFKKLVVADNVAVVANKIFAVSEPSFSLVWTGTLAFGVQIYADFSAYSDIARGAAKLLGFDLMKNFDHPYLSQTPGEFWRRWHISLSSWFRDYVYIPLGGSRGSKLVHYRNVMITFLLSGFWHGASWNFILWGGFHGLILIVYELCGRAFPKLLTMHWLAVPRTVVCFALVNVGWLMFRETDAQQLFHDLALRPGGEAPADLLAAGNSLGTTLFYALPLIIDDALAKLGLYARVRPTFAWASLQAGLVVVLVIGMSLLYSDVPSEFIYFQF